MVNKKTIWDSIVVYLSKFKELSKAVAKLHKLNNNIDSREFAQSVAVDMFDELCSVDDLYRQCTFVVITSERSCCDKLNNEVLSCAKDAIESFLEENKQIHLISVGWKGRNSLYPKYKYDFFRNSSKIVDMFMFDVNSNIESNNNSNYTSDSNDSYQYSFFFSSRLLFSEQKEKKKINKRMEKIKNFILNFGPQHPSAHGVFVQYLS